MATDNPYLLDADCDRQSAQVIQIESSKGLLLHSVLAAVAIVGCVAFGIMAYNATRETRMLEYYVMELDGKVMQAGIIKPEESWSAKKRKQLEQLEKTQ